MTRRIQHLEPGPRARGQTAGVAGVGECTLLVRACEWLWPKDGLCLSVFPKTATALAPSPFHAVTLVFLPVSPPFECGRACLTVTLPLEPLQTSV